MDSGLGISGHSKSVLQMTTSKLDYESPFIVENGVTKTHEITIQTHSNTSSNGPIEFHLVPDPEKFTDASSVKLHGKVGIHYKNSDGVWENIRNLPNTPKFGVINNFFSSLISSCVVKVNDCEIGENSSNSYPYMCYLQTLLGTSASQSGCKILEERAFYKDEANRMERPDLDEDKEAFSLRRKRFTERDWTDFHIPLHNDLMTAEKYLPPKTKLSFTLKRTEDNFLIWKGSDSDLTDYKVVLQDLYLTIDQLEVAPEILKNFNDKYGNREKSPPLKIKYTQNVLKSFAVPANQTELKHHNLFFGSHLPDKKYVCIVEQEAYNGDSNKNPFNFETANMKEAYLVVNGVKEPSTPYQFTRGTEENSCYLKFLSNTGTSPFEMDGVNISSQEYKNGYFVLAFDRSPTQDNGLYTHKAQPGSMSLMIKCSAATAKHYMVLVLASYDSVLTFAEDKVLTESLY